MKLHEVTKKKIPICYVGVNLSEQTEREILQYINDNDIPNPTKQKDLHSTVVFSKTPFKYKALGDVQETAKPIKFETFTNDQNNKITNCLILLIESDFLTAQYKLLTSKHGAVSDFPDYRPHITLSYDIGDMDFSKLPKYSNDIEIIEEYYSTFDY